MSDQIFDRLNIDQSYTFKNRPDHVGIIMDGNGRWGEKKVGDRSYGHKCSIPAIEQSIQVCLKQQIPYLTLYAFSQENWQRPAKEVITIFETVAQAAIECMDSFIEQNVKFQVVGDMVGVPKFCLGPLQKVMDSTKHNTRLCVSVALNYSGQEEIVASSKDMLHNFLDQVINEFLKQGFNENTSCSELIKFIRKYRFNITTRTYEKFLCTKDLPPIDLVIRTGARKRLSNFLLWKIAYAEIYFTDVLWPDFCKEDFLNALSFFDQQHRTLGAVI